MAASFSSLVNSFTGTLFLAASALAFSSASFFAFALAFLAWFFEFPSPTLGASYFF